MFILVCVRNASPFSHFQQLCFMSSIPLFCTFTKLTSLPIPPKPSLYVHHGGQCLRNLAVSQAFLPSGQTWGTEFTRKKRICALVQFFGKTEFLARAIHMSLDLLANPQGWKSSWSLVGQAIPVFYSCFCSFEQIRLVFDLTILTWY